MLGKGLLKKLCIAVLSIIVLSSYITTTSSPTANNVYADSHELDEVSLELNEFSSFREDDYSHYIALYGNKPMPNEEIIIEAESFSRIEGMEYEILENFANSTGKSLRTDEEGVVEWEVEVEQEGIYNIGMRYFPIEGKSSSIERELLIDGVLPFAGAGILTFPRVWANELAEMEQDNRGNDLRPRQKEAPIWRDVLFQDADGYYERPYHFYFTKGKHTISLISSREPMVIDYLILQQEEKVPTYSEVVNQYKEKGYKEVQDVMIKIQGEEASLKSAPTLYPISDRASPATEPYHVSKIRMNTIGGNNWRMPGQWIAWDVDVPEDGLYKIAIKHRQNLLRGLYSTRKLWIDDKIPFQEMEKLSFYYDGNFQLKVLGDDQPYLFYLTKGQHQLRLEITLGDFAPLLRQVESSVLELNHLYRKILMITGAVPDKFRDYRLERQIPEMIEVFQRQSETLYTIAKNLQEITGETSDKAAILNTTAYQLQDFANRPDTIPQRIDQFKINVGGLGTWILMVREQPLEIDYVMISSPDVTFLKPEASLWGKIWHEFTAFFFSFIEDYNSIGDVSDGEETVTVWIGTGRDQAQVLKAMIDDTFTAKTGIHVNLKLVQMQVLLPATLANQGPDIAMQIGNDIPVNYAIRKAVHDLSEFPDYKQVAERFRDSAILPYEFENGVYALPEQQVFSMLFYRKDIMQELGLEVPNTWEELSTLIPELQKKNMELALPLTQDETAVANLVPNQSFAMLLYQSDGQFYEGNGEASALDSDISMATFKKWTELYTNYKLPLKFDFPNRFRTGEMPMGIVDYTFYNHLAVSAPEIRGLWEFVPVPGTMMEDGSIRREVSSGGTSVIMLENAKDKDAAWEFMKWWTSKEMQVRFGREMEGLMGAAARYPTANIEALKELPWPIKDYRNLEKQWEWVRGIPEVPGGYFTGRHLDNSFREVINNGTNAREALYDYVRIIDEEIDVKRKEFNLSE